MSFASLKSRAAAGAALFVVTTFACPLVGAVSVVDTGQPTGTNDAYVLFNDSLSFQNLGITFSIDSHQTLDSIKGWFNTNNAGQVTASLWLNAPSTSSSALFSATTLVSAANARWVEFGPTDWSVGPGTYALTFSAGVGYDGGMPDHAPVTLSQYWFQGTSYPNWLDTYGLGIGVQIGSVTAVPEPETTGLLLAGLGALALRTRRRNKVSARAVPGI